MGRRVLYGNIWAPKRMWKDVKGYGEFGISKLEVLYSCGGTCN